MAQVFISYSRRDTDCARRLTESFKGQDLDLWIDWQSIPPTVDWWSEIQKGIEQADVFLFLVSPASIRSKVCRREIDYALRNGKRLIPVVVRDVNAEEAPSVLSHLNWIFIRENDDFNTAFEKLITAIKTDYDWVKAHRELQVDALEWERNKHDKSYLLRGTELQLAEFQLTTNSSKEPHPTDLQRDYLRISRQAADKQRRLITSIAIGVIIALAVLGTFGWFQAGVATNAKATAVANLLTAEAAKALADSNAATAVANAQIARAGELAALAVSQRDERLDLSLLLSVEALKTVDTPRAKSVLLDSTQTNPQLLQHMHGHSSWVTSVALSPDGKTLASGSDDRTIILWDVATGQRIHAPLIGHPSTVDRVVFSPDGKTLASSSCGKLEQNNEGCEEGMVILWDVETGQRIGEPLTGHSSGIFALAFSPDGKTLATASDSLILWDVKKHEGIEQSLSGENNFINSLAFSPDGSLLALGMADGIIILWDMASGQPVGEHLAQDAGSVMRLAFSPDGKILASAASYEIGITLWDVANRAIKGQLVTGSTSDYRATDLTSLAFSPDGLTLASGRSYSDLKGTVSDAILWDVETRQAIRQPLTGQRGRVNNILFSPDGEIRTAGSNGNTVLLWDLREQHPIGQSLTGQNETVQGLGFSPDGKTLATVGKKTILLWDTASREPISQTPTGQASSVSRAVFSPNGKLLASAGSDDTAIFLWDVAKREHLGQLTTGYRYAVGSLAFSPDGKRLASGSIDSPIILWDVDTLKPIGQLPTASAYSVTGLAFSPDGKILASAEEFAVGGQADSMILLWDMETLKPFGRPLAGRSVSVTGLAFSPDGKTLASGNWDSNIILWDVKSQQQIGSPLTGQMGYLSSLAFSPDGKILAAARNVPASQVGEDYTILLWDVASRQLMGLPLKGHSKTITNLVFSPDGKSLASSSEDALIIVWNLDPASWIERSCQRAGRNLTPAEWTHYFPSDQYRATCPQWPLEPVLEVTNSLQE